MKLHHMKNMCPWDGEYILFDIFLSNYFFGQDTSVNLNFSFLVNSGLNSL